jgi:ubiquinone/menaquinone biosynthesis C-methylase UbiE
MGDSGMIRRAFAKGMRVVSRQPDNADSQWFWDHYETAAGEIAAFCEVCQVKLAGREIADVGCGDGIMALGLCERAHPQRLVGFDIVPTDPESLLARAQAQRAVSSLPAELEFRGSSPTGIPAGDGEFDFVYSWSAFEHIEAPVGVLREIRRILRPTGHFFLQLWPFHRSAKGSHLWDWFPEDFHHLVRNERDTVEALHASDRHSPEWTTYMAREFEHLNRITPGELQRSMLAGGFEVQRVELMTAPFHLTPELQRYSWADLGISGIKLMATPRP